MTFPGRLGLSTNRLGLGRQTATLIGGPSGGPNLADLSATTYNYTGDGGAEDYQGISFNNAGTKMFVSVDTDNEVITYNLSTAWDVSSRAIDAAEIWAPVGFSQPQDHVWTPDGTRIIAISSGVDEWNWADVSTPFDLSTEGAPSDQAIADTAIPTGIAFNADGTALFLGTLEDTVIKFVLSTPYDPSSKDGGAVVLTATPEMTQLGFGMAFAPDGLKFYAGDVTDAKIHQYNLTVAYDLTTAAHQAGQTISSAGTFIAGMHMRPNGEEIYISHSLGNRTITRWA